MAEGPRRSKPASVALCSAVWPFRCRRLRGTTCYDPYHSLHLHTAISAARMQAAWLRPGLEGRAYHVLLPDVDRSKFGIFGVTCMLPLVPVGPPDRFRPGPACGQRLVRGE